MSFLGFLVCVVFTGLCLCLQLGTPQQKPKRLRLLADVSGSMYRFNGVDGRLERSMEAVCMVMEALESYEHKFRVRYPAAVSVSVLRSLVHWALFRRT